MVDAVGYAEPPYQRREPDAAGYHEDQGRAAAGTVIALEILNPFTQPTQEFVDPSYVTVIAQHSIEENRQFVNDEKNWLVIRGAVAEQGLPFTPPGSGVQAGADLHTKVARADLLDIVTDPASHSGHETWQDSADWMSRLRDFRNHVLGARCVFDVNEKENPLWIPGLEQSPQFLSNACLTHPPLSGQQYVITVAYQCFQCLQLGSAIEKIVAAYPSPGG